MLVIFLMRYVLHEFILILKPFLFLSRSLEAKTLKKNIFKMFLIRFLFIYLSYYTRIPCLTLIAEILCMSAPPGLDISFTLNVHSIWQY